MSRFIDFSEGKALMVNNADWLLDLNYLQVLREVGACFSVNRMLTAECYKQRMEKGLSFLEFNYMIMQSYDFYTLFQKYGCNLQFGGDDQWSNMLGGTELIRRKLGEDASAMTITLLLNSEGKKMGKTQKGAVWLDPEKTSPYEFYQYWRNVTNLVHGEEEAKKAQEAARAIFSGGANSANMPTTQVEADSLTDDSIGLMDLMVLGGMVKSKGEARRLITQGGVSLNDEKVGDVYATVSKADLEAGAVVRKGKKVFRKFTL